MKEGQSCGKCIHWLKKDENGGECRRNPPHVIAIHSIIEMQIRDVARGLIVNKPQLQVQAQGFFPMTKAEDLGCGEYSEDYNR